MLRRSMAPYVREKENEMLNQLRHLFRAFAAPQERQRGYDPDDVRLAVAALLVHCMAIDGAVQGQEMAKLRDLLTRSFNLPGGDLQLLIDDAVAAEREAVDLYRFTSVIKRQMSEEQRVRLVEQLWEIVYADGKSHEFEDNLVWRVAELLAVNRQARLASKLSVAENSSDGGKAAG